ncbi:MAG: hypothetical protein KDB27_34755, partial [Planctomycetales bacterium]|nr:hypothetical protein [Planctomycetales bacterium]
NGFYSFVGLRQAVYAVYQDQPSGYIDGIDTGGYVESSVETEIVQLSNSRTGASRAVAWNKNDPGSEVFQNALVDPPLYDAISLIDLLPGERSLENNFSEIVVRNTPVIPGPPPPNPTQNISPGSIPDIDSYRANRRLVELNPYEIKSAGRIRGRANTWHLSVIDGGTPRGEGRAVVGDANAWFQRSGKTLLTSTGTDSYEWTLIFDEDDVRVFRFGAGEGIPVIGDWNGDGVDDFGVYARGHWLIDVNGNRRWDNNDLWAKLGYKTDQPVTGDWDADGKDDIGIFGPAWPGDPIAVYLEPGLPDRENAPTGETKNVPPAPEDTSQVDRTMQLTADGVARSDVIDHVFHFGGIGDQAVTGDWNGDGVASIGVFRDGNWILDKNGDGRFTRIDMSAQFGRRGDIPIVGDFDGDGIDDIGIFRDGKFYLDANGNHKLDPIELATPLETTKDGFPIVGDWDGDGRDNVGVVRSKEMRFVEVESRVP